MIVCPNCEAENADNANHCGNCGSRLQKGSGQKTMFGFAAVSQEQMEQAAKEVAASKAAAEQGDDAKPKIPKPNVPSPGGGLGAESSVTSGSSLPKPGGLNLPKPGQTSSATPEPTQPASIRDTDPNLAFGDTHPPGSSNLSAGGEPPKVDLGAPETAEEAAPGRPTTQPEAGASPLSPPTEPETGGWQDSPSSSGDSSWDDAGSAAPTATASDDSWGSQPDAAPAAGLPSGSPGGQDLMAGGGGGGGFGGGGMANRGEVRDPVMVLVFAMISCGFYLFFWLFQVMQEINGALGEERFNPVVELVLAFFTCGVWYVWLMWRVCESIVEVQERFGVQPEMDAPILFVTNFVYVGPFFMQKSLNNAWENGSA